MSVFQAFKPKKRGNRPEAGSSHHQRELTKQAASPSAPSAAAVTAEVTLGSGDLRLAVALPEGEDVKEWVAGNTVDFFRQISMLYGTLTPFCRDDTCPVMSAGPRYEYLWADGRTVKKPVRCSAPRYIDDLLTWVQDQMDDQSLFPARIGVPFPASFLSVARTILRRLFRVYAHIYHHHFKDAVRLSEVAHLNTSFKHFVLFVQEFHLVERKELAPLQELIDKLTSRERKDR